MRLGALVTTLSLASIAFAQERYGGSAALDQAIEQVVSARTIPGAVLIVGRGSKILHRKAYGYRALLPQALAFDIGFGRERSFAQFGGLSMGAHIQLR